ncbi:hypothetical protein [Sporosarcina obsidiansis]|uniref:hypothetical protein n=1 Tax=Sporosarcina obsidiansis TaxID=2660748 RepID=UPI00129AEFC9|nr:hypothetical protein [Sporosarcina obsidiansis]
MSERKLESRILYILVTVLLISMLTLCFGILMNENGFKPNKDLVNPISTFLGALLGAGLSGGIAIYAAKVQVNKQQDIFLKEIEYRDEKEKNKEKQNLVKLHKKQLLVLQKIEIELIKIIQQTSQVQRQAQTVVFNSGNSFLQTVTKIKKTNNYYWDDLDFIMDLNLKFHLQLLKDQYNEFTEILAIETAAYEDDIDLLKLKIADLISKKDKGFITEEEKIRLKQLNFKKMKILVEYHYYKDEKKSMWIVAKNGTYIHLADDLRNEVRNLIDESSKICGVKVSGDPFELIDL